LAAHIPADYQFSYFEDQRKTGQPETDLSSQGIHFEKAMSAVAISA
jgi:hypothetical protein